MLREAGFRFNSRSDHVSPGVAARRRASAAVAVLVSVCGHLAFFVLVLSDVHPAPIYADIPAMDVRLARPWRVKAASVLSSAAPARHHLGPSSAAVNRPMPLGPPPIADTPAAVRPQGHSPVEAGVSAALRAAVGCDYGSLLNLSAAERHACDRLNRERAAGVGTVQFQIEPEKQAAFDEGAKRDAILQQPFLAQKPTKGCRPSASEQDGGVNSNKGSQDWRVSVGCAFPF